MAKRTNSLHQRLVFHPTLCCLSIILRNELNDLLQICERVVRDQDFEIHCGSRSLTCSMGRTRPDFTSFNPRCKAASSRISSGCGPVAKSSAVRSALSRGFKCAIAVLISSSVLICRTIIVVSLPKCNGSNRDALTHTSQPHFRFVISLPSAASGTPSGMCR